MASAQLPLKGSFTPDAVTADGKISSKDENGAVRFSGDGWNISFNKENGTLQSLNYGGSEMIHDGNGLQFYGYRTINNEPRDFKEHSFDLKDLSWEVNDGGNKATVSADLVATVGDTSVPHKVVYTIYPDGTIDVNATFSTPEKFEMPRLGLRGMFNKSLERLEWFGRGPIENYPDRKAAAFVGKYSSTIENMRENYVRSQSMGTRTDTRWMTLSDSNGKGIKISALGDHFDFTALHFTDEEIWNAKYGHDLDKVRRPETVLNIDCATRGLGSASCGPGPRPEFKLVPDTTYNYSFRISAL